MIVGAKASRGSVRRPVIVLSCMRSYSSVVSGMLGQHPQLYGLPEVNLFVADTMRQQVKIFLAVRPISLNGLLRTIAQLEFGEQTEQSVEAAKAWIGSRLHWTTLKMYHYIIERVDPLRCVDKCPITVLTMAFLRRCDRFFPEAQYLHLTRHPHPTCRSIAKIIGDTDRKRGTNRLDGSDPEAVWFKANNNAVEFMASLAPGRAITIQGERLLGQPDVYLAQISEFLDVDGSQESIDAMKHPERSPYSSIGPANAPFGSDPSYLRNPYYNQRPIPPESLDALPDWPGRTTNVGLSEPTVHLARQLGYQ